MQVMPRGPLIWTIKSCPESTRAAAANDIAATVGANSPSDTGELSRFRRWPQHDRIVGAFSPNSLTDGVSGDPGGDETATRTDP